MEQEDWMTEERINLVVILQKSSRWMTYRIPHISFIEERMELCRIWLHMDNISLWIIPGHTFLYHRFGRRGRGWWQWRNGCSTSFCLDVSGFAGAVIDGLLRGNIKFDAQNAAFFQRACRLFWQCHGKSCFWDGFVLILKVSLRRMRRGVCMFLLEWVELLSSRVLAWES